MSYTNQDDNTVREKLLNDLTVCARLVNTFKECLNICSIKGVAELEAKYGIDTPQPE